MAPEGERTGPFLFPEAISSLIRPGPVKAPVFFELIGSKTGFARAVLNGGPHRKQPTPWGCRSTEGEGIEAGQRVIPETTLAWGVKSAAGYVVEKYQNQPL